MISLKIQPDEAGMRLDRKLRKLLPLHSLSDIYRLIRTGRIRVNGKKIHQGHRLCDGDALDLDVDSVELTAAHSAEDREALASLAGTEYFRRNLRVIFEDQDLLACNKPPNIVVHPGTGHIGRDSLIDLVKSYMMKTGEPGNEPLLVHRIDRDTSGIVLIAKNLRILRLLHVCFRERSIEKRYYAICHGKPRKERGAIEVPLAKTIERNSGTKVTADEEGLSARTDYRLVRSGAGVSQMEISISTGRTHQIRVHMAHIGCPVVGDVRYGDRDLDKEIFSRPAAARRLYLHAFRLSFINPLNLRPQTLTAPLPDEFSALMKTADKRRGRV